MMIEELEADIRNDLANEVWIGSCNACGTNLQQGHSHRLVKCGSSAADHRRWSRMGEPCEDCALYCGDCQ